jgi:hypothetical protein
MPRASNVGLVVLTILGGPVPVQAGPSSNVWAPSAASVQGDRVLHLTYDTYFAPDALYPVDLGLTIGALPWQALQLELGADVLYPTPGADGGGLAVPVVFNAKLGGAEDLAFRGQPAWSVGVYNVGLEKGVTDYDIAYALLGKSGLPYVGALSLGAYYGPHGDLLRSSDGEVHRAGLIAGWFSPAIDLPVLDRLHLAADLQSGKNVVGAAGAALYVYLNPTIDLATGPVYFLDPDLQPGRRRWMWTVQLDVDVDLRSR